MSTYGSTETGLYDSLMDELSYDQIQQMLDQIMGENSFSFSEMVRSLMHSGKADTLDNISTMMWEIAASAFSTDRKLFGIFKLFQKTAGQGGRKDSLLYCIYVIFCYIILIVFADCLAGRKYSGKSADICKGNDTGIFYQSFLYTGRCSCRGLL